MKQKTIELAQALIRRSSISPNDEGCQQLIAERLEKLGFEIEWMPFNDTLNLWAKHGVGEPVIALQGIPMWYRPEMKRNGFIRHFLPKLWMICFMVVVRQI